MLKGIPSLEFKINHKKRNLHNKVARLEELKATEQSGQLFVLFGSKKLLIAQYNLHETGYINHEEWREEKALSIVITIFFMWETTALPVVNYCAD